MDRKEKAKAYREQQKNSPRMLELKEKKREARRAAYAKLKESRKAARLQEKTREREAKIGDRKRRDEELRRMLSSGLDADSLASESIEPPKEPVKLRLIRTEMA